MGNCLGHRDGVSSVCFDSENTYIFSGSYDSTCIIWDFITYQMIYTF